MQAKQSLDKLENRRFYNKIATMFYLLMTTYIVYKGEKEDLDYTRFLAVFLLFLAYKFYNQNDLKAKKLINNIKGDRLFRRWAAEDNVDLMTYYLSEEVQGALRIDNLDPDTFKNALHFAVENGSLKAVEYLVDTETKTIATYLTHPARFIHAKPDLLNQQDKDGNTPVHKAIYQVLEGSKNSYEILLKILEKELNGEFDYNSRIDPTIKNDAGLTIQDLNLLLKKHEHKSKFTQAIDTIEKIYTERLPIDDKEFRLAAQNNQVARMAKYLKLHGAFKISAKGEASGKNALHFAVAAHAEKAVVFLLEIRTKATEKTAAHKNDNTEITKLLDIINHQDKNGDTPIHIAIMKALEGPPIALNILIELISLTKNSVTNGIYTYIVLDVYNEAIDVSLKNNSGFTLLDLVKDKMDQSNPNHQRIHDMIGKLTHACQLANEKKIEGSITTTKKNN